MNPHYHQAVLRVSHLLGASLALLILTGCGRDSGNGDAGPPRMPPSPVTAVEVKARDVAVRAVYPGRVRGFREVEVRARVGGILEERLYTEGQVVDQGTPLFRIDPRPYEIALQQAEAERANARAARNQAEREWRRINGLFEQKAVSEREHDRALSERELAAARMLAAEARVAEARLQLEYTTVVAPIPGPTGLESLPEGSLIERGTLLTTIVQSDPVQVRFSLPERDALLRRAATRGDEQKRIGAELILPDGSVHDATGIVDFTDSLIDARTGAVSARALFDNPDGNIVPGQFVRVRLLLEDLTGVFAINPAAIAQSPEGPLVFIVTDDNTAEARPVRLGPLVDGRRIVLEGLSTGDRVIISGLVMLQPGAPVSPRIIEED